MSKARKTALQAFADHFASSAFGETPAEAKMVPHCVACKEPAEDFRDELSRTEYAISALCQTCQDKFFET